MKSLIGSTASASQAARSSLELAHDRVAPYERPWLGPTFEDPHNDVWVVDLTNGIHVAPVPCLKPSAHDLDVLLRHHQRSLSPPQ